MRKVGADDAGRDRTFWSVRRAAHRDRRSAEVLTARAASSQVRGDARAALFCRPRTAISSAWTCSVCAPGAVPEMRVLGTMATVNPVVDETPGAADLVDPESAEWLGALAGKGVQREAALARLHEMLLRIAQRECRRRSPRLRITGPELEDLAYQAAADALVAITRKLGQFRGESRFTTWAYKFVILEVSDKIGRHFWQNPGVPLDAGDWDKLPDRFGFEPAQEAEWRDLLVALRRAVDTELSPRQRQVFVAIVVNAVPLDALVIELSSNRNAIYKTMFDARRKLRAALAANGYMGHDTAGRS
jgi:RNA polymerase sigma-70 factor, ECF subfamily